MKKIIILSFAFVAMSTASFAQAEVALGIKGGLNFANIDVSSSSAAYNSRTGYHAGAFLLIKLSKIGIQPEIIFSRQGSSYKPFSGTTVDARYDYVNIPVILKLYTVAGINLQVGPQFGFLAGATNEITVNGSTTSQDVKSALKGSDISLALGLGWDLPFGLTIDGRYNLGISDNNNSGTSNNVKNQVIQISAGFKLFKFGK